MKNQYRRMGYLKRGHGQFVELRGAWQGIGKGCF